MVEIFREVRRVLTDGGTCFLNLGDSYFSDTKGGGSRRSAVQNSNAGACFEPRRFSHDTLKPKDLVGIPWRVAFALQADGWWLRQDIIWCLSGGTWLYVRSQKGDMPMTVKDVARLDPATVQLWSGDRWTQLLGMSSSQRKGDELEIVLRSGERISCTMSHRFPTERGLLPASEVIVGDVLRTCVLPEPLSVKDCALDEDAAWLAGLYLAEGSRSDDMIRIAGHVKETARFARVRDIAQKYGGSCTVTEDGNSQNIRICGKVLNAIIDTFVSGRTAKDKGFNPVVWRYSNLFIEAMLDGYLSGDGHKDGDRWRLGFTRNYNLERGIRTACARLGYSLTLNFSSVPYNGRRVATFLGEIRKQVSKHRNNKSRSEVVAIRKSRCRKVWEIGVADEPHLFALASGVLTHNSKPDPMPESVKDRCTKSHEYIFLLTKSARYYWDGDAIAEEALNTSGWAKQRERGEGHQHIKPGFIYLDGREECQYGLNNATNTERRNARSVWTMNTQPYGGAHFAVFPLELPRRCILAGCPHKVCSLCGKPYKRKMQKPEMMQVDNSTVDRYGNGSAGIHRKVGQAYQNWRIQNPDKCLGYFPTCNCNAPPEGGVVLDPFAGSGTTLFMARELGCRYIGIELNPEYIALIEKRLEQQTLFGGA